MMVQRPRIFEDREYIQPATPWLWKDQDVQLQKTPTGWAVLDGDKTICVAGCIHPMNRFEQTFLKKQFLNIL